MALLEIRVRDQLPVRYPLRWGELTLGRNPDAELCLPLPAVSGRHATLQLQLRVRDLGSTNGTRIAGECVEDVVLNDSTPVEIGRDGAITVQVLFDESVPMVPSLEATLLEPDPSVNANEAVAVAAHDASAHRLSADAGNSDGNDNRDDDATKVRAISHTPSAAVEPSAAQEAALVESQAEVSKLQARVAQLEQQLQQQASSPKNKRSKKNGAAKPQATTSKEEGDEAGQTHLFSRLGELQEKLHREQNARSAAESKLKVLSHSGFSGAQEALQLVQQQRSKIEELETALEISQQRADRIQGDGGVDTTIESIAKDALLAHLRKEMGLDKNMVEQLGARQSLPSDCGFLLGRLYTFSRDIERVVTRLAQRYRGGIASADQTIMPGAVGNLSQSVHGLLLRGSNQHRKQLEETLSNLRVWCGICLTAYEQGAKRWSRELLQRITPMQIQQQVGNSFLKRALALEGWECWKLYRNVMQDVTADIAQDQIDDLAADAASEMAEREGAW